jgi:periplasmic protein TonB
MKFEICRIFLILICSFCAVNAFGQKNKPNPCETPTAEGNGFSGSSRSELARNNGLAIDPAPTRTNNSDEKPKVYPVGTKPVRISSKPRAFYTELANEKCVQGKVVLKVTFFSNGQVGKIKVVKGLPFGLSEQAVEVAKRIRFEPAMKGGKPITVTKKVEYNFTIY